MLAGLLQFAGKWRVKDPEMVWKSACLWVHFREEIQKRTSVGEYQELDVGVRRGVYTQQLNDHVKAENPNFTVDAFRFLHSLSSFVPVNPDKRQPVVVAMDVDNALANNEDPLKVQGEVAFEMGMLTKIGNLLLKEQKLWDVFLKQSDDFHNRERVDARRRAQVLNDEVALASQEYQMQNYPIITITSEANFLSRLSSCKQSWADARAISEAFMYTVYFADLTKLGSASTHAYKKIIRTMADGTTQNNKKQTIGIIIAPNVAARGDQLSDKAVKEAVDDVEQQLDELEGIAFRKCTASFTEKSASASRPGTFNFWLLISAERCPEMKDFFSHFRQSRLWKTRTVVDIVRMKVAERVAPYNARVKDSQNLSPNQRHKQETSGVSMWDRLRSALYAGMGLTNANGVIFYDMCAYDDSLVTACLSSCVLGRPNQPQETVVSVFAYKTDCEGSTFKKGSEWLMAAILRRLSTKIKDEKSLKIEGLDIQSLTTCPLKRPSFNLNEFEVAIPLADDKTLAMRQTTLDEWGKKFIRKKDDWTKILSEHDKKYNIAGTVYKGETKRPASNPAEEKTGSVFSEGDTKPSLEELKKDGTVIVLESYDKEIYELCITKGELWIHAFVDGTLSTLSPILGMYGQYYDSEDIGPAKKNKDVAARLCYIKVENTDFKAFWKVPDDWTDQFQRGPATLENFLDHLLTHKQITKPKIECHTIKEGGVVESSEELAFCITGLHRKTSPNKDCAGSLLDWSLMDWGKMTHSHGTMDILFGWAYVHTNQEEGINPTLPAFVMKKAMKIEKGKVYRLA